MEDAADSSSAEGNLVWVRIPLGVRIAIYITVSTYDELF